MKKLKQFLLMAAVLGVMMGTAAEAEAQENNISTVTAEEVNWMPAPDFFPEGAEFAVIKGDPGQAGPFTVRLRFPAGYEIPAHKHPSYEHITVLSGTLYIGEGEQLDHAKGTALPTGSFAYGPEDQHHAAWATDEEAVIQIQSEGPFEIHYFNPDDDPRKKQEVVKKGD